MNGDLPDWPELPEPDDALDLPGLDAEGGLDLFEPSAPLEPDAPGDGADGADGAGEAFHVDGPEGSAADDLPGSPPPAEIVLDLSDDGADGGGADDGVPAGDDGLDAGGGGGDPALAEDAVAGSFSLDVAAYDAVTERLDLSGPLGGHDAAVVLGELGVDAALLHGDLDALAASVRAGDEVVVHGPDGPLSLVALDDRTARFRDGVTGALLEVPTPELEAAWEQASYAMLVAEPVAATGEVVLATGPVTVLAMTWSPR